MNSRRYVGLDVLKCFACIAVVLIHYPFPEKGDALGFSQIVRIISKFAVPFFFAVSGFFCLKDGGALYSADRIVAKAKHVLRILGYASLFYTAFTLIYYPLVDVHWSLSVFFKQYFTGIRIIRFFLTMDPFYYAHLWFLWGLFLCYMTMLFVDSRIKLNALFFCAPILMIGFSLMQEFHVIKAYYCVNGIAKGGVVLCNMFVFRALPFFCLGMLARTQERRICSVRFPNGVLFALIFAGMLIAVGERFVLGNCPCQFYLGNFLTAGAMLLWGIRDGQCREGILTYAGRHLSLHVYVLHIACGSIVGRIGMIQHFGPWYAWVKPLAVILFTFAASMVVYKLSKRTRKG